MVSIIADIIFASLLIACIIVFVGGALAALVGIVNKSWLPSSTRSDAVFVKSTVAAIILFVITGVFGAFMDLIYAYETVQKAKTTPIKSLRDNPGVSGRFSLGFGSIDGAQRYYFGVQTDHGFRVRYVSDNGDRPVYIKQGADTPRVVWYAPVCSSGCEWNLNKVRPKKDAVRVVIHVPSDTVKKSYSVDMK